MYRIVMALLLAIPWHVSAQRNCDPNAGLVDASCIDNPDPAPEPESKARTTRAALLEYFGASYRRPRLEKGPASVSLELCFDNCAYYRASRVENAFALWDLVFLHQYYFAGEVDEPKFRAKYARLASLTLNVHSAGCEADSEEDLAGCVVPRLAQSLNARYWFVRYDEGERCQMAGDFANRTSLGKVSCRRIQPTQ
jgi:hypothetical protein